MGLRSHSRHKNVCSRGSPLGWVLGVWCQVTAGPTWGRDGDQVSQQALEGAFLVGLVGDIRQVDPAEVGGMAQNHITHLEGEDVALKVLFQV